MARIKFTPGTDPINNKHLGFTFQRNAYGFSMFPGARPRRARNVNQSQRMSNLMKAVNIWRSLEPPAILAWENFAATYPQASRRNPAVFLTGYQLFIKRAHYIYLNSGIEADIISYPKLESLANPVIDVSIEAGNNCLDITDLYISNFGIIPDVGQTILCKVYPMAMESGQFFEAITQTITVTQVYVDGMFLSINWTAPKLPITFSVYLSKVINPGQDYTGTKVRFMGCFSAKTFLELTDTPDDYAGQGEKTVAVKADETGLEFVAGGGGGLSCEDLVNCPTIISILASIQNIAEIVSKGFNTSIPAPFLGLLYNWYATQNSAKIFSSDDWEMLTSTTMATFRTYVGGFSAAGLNIRLTGTDFWQPTNTGATNLYLMNLKGVGRRNTNGSFAYVYINTTWWHSNEKDTSNAYAGRVTYNSANISSVIISKKEGNFVLGRKLASGIPDGTAGIYICNNCNIIRTIAIGGYYYFADPFTETKYRDGSDIPEITDNTEWQNDTTGALCAYNNDWNNV